MLLGVGSFRYLILRRGLGFLAFSFSSGFFGYLRFLQCNFLPKFGLFRPVSRFQCQHVLFSSFRQCSSHSFLTWHSCGLHFWALFFKFLVAACVYGHLPLFALDCIVFSRDFRDSLEKKLNVLCFRGLSFDIWIYHRFRQLIVARYGCVARSQ